MPDVHQDFIERMGLLTERDGFSRTAGRLFGLLILEKGPFSLDELAETLEISKASASTNARMLEQAGIAERRGIPGDRRDYYLLAPDAMGQVLASVRVRMRDVRDLLAATGEALPETADARDRIDQVHEFYDFMITEFDSMFRRWKERRSPGRAREDSA